MEELTLSDYFAILRRWRKVFLLTALILLALLMTFALRWSNYRATATVQIEQPEISSAATNMGETSREQIEALADQRLNALEQKVLSTPSLIEVITKFDLYAKERENTPIAHIAEKTMFKNIKLELVSNALSNKEAIAFTINFEYHTPLLAQQVTNELVTRFLDEDLKERRTEAHETSAFLGSQIADLEASLSDQEKKIADYQSQHGTSRPESLAFNQQLVATLTLNLQGLDSQISANEGSTGSLRAQLSSIDPYSRLIADGQVLTTPSSQLKALKSQYAALTAQYGPEYPDVVKVRHQIEALESHSGHETKETSQLKAQIADLRTNLEAAEKTYGPEHPDVVSMKNQMQKLEDQLATNKASAPPASASVAADADNPAYLQLVAQIHTMEEQHKSLLEQRKELQAQLDTYEKALIENPEAEKEMAALTRDHENAELRYRELKEKKMAADMNEQMQKDRTGARLVLVNPPELPIDTYPLRIFLIAFGVLFSLVGSFAAVIAAQMLNQGIVGPHHVESIVGVAPLVCIPHIFTHEEHTYSLRHRLCQGTFALGGACAEFSAPYHKKLIPYCRERLASCCKRFIRPKF
jgi:uncharacterized protein involved in exopolysaccharide biosynthesis